MRDDMLTGGCDNVLAWRVGRACAKAAASDQVGDYIDRGLVLLRELAAEGFGVVRVEEGPIIGSYARDPAVMAEIVRKLGLGALSGAGEG